MSSSDDGFSLVETLVATLIVVVALVGLGQLLVLSSGARNGSATRTIATMLARDKLEELVSRDLEPESGVEFLDARLRPLEAADEAIYVRRWIVDPVASSPNLLALQVWVTTARGGPAGESRLTLVKTRTAP